MDWTSNYDIFSKELCSHPAPGLITHKMSSGNVWTRCVQCDKIWESAKEPAMKCSKCGVYTSDVYAEVGKSYCSKCQTTKLAATSTPGKKGDVRRLPRANSPMWTTQWSVTGSAQQPYIVSHKTNGSNGSTTSDGWACSCMSFTQNTPREDCKHILKVKLSEGMSLAAKASHVVPPSHAKEYAEFLALKAQKERAVLSEGEVKMVGDSTGRKFR